MPVAAVVLVIAPLVPVAAVVLVIAVLGLVWARRLRGHGERLAEVTIVDSHEPTSVDSNTGAVRSLQAADLLMPTEALEEIWSPRQLERLARTYWRFLSHATLGLVRVRYTEHERFVVLLASPLKLLTFQAPEYEMDDTRGVVRWRIERGLLVARRGRGGNGYLQIDMQRSEDERSPRARLHVEIEVANFYPAIASRLGRRIYNETQSRIHVIVTNGFLRSLARLDLEESRVGRFASIEEVPDPPPPDQPAGDRP
ncbi:MAG TPA: hypothetical protein VGG98_07735 [Solirubrobacteraceae bacterium]